MQYDSFLGVVPSVLVVRLFSTQWHELNTYYKCVHLKSTPKRIVQRFLFQEPTFFHVLAFVKNRLYMCARGKELGKSSQKERPGRSRALQTPGGRSAAAKQRPQTLTQLAGRRQWCQRDTGARRPPREPLPPAITCASQGRAWLCEAEDCREKQSHNKPQNSMSFHNKIFSVNYFSKNHLVWVKCLEVL